MANEVKWIKIATGIFDDEAFQIIDDLPECDAIELIWFKLLILAGKQNNHGLFLYKDTMAYTDEMLASIFHRPINTVRLAMETFVKLRMVEQIDDVYAIPNWDKYQSLDSLESKKERDKEYSKKYREKQKLLLEEKKSSDSRLTSDEPSYSISYSISNSDSLSLNNSNKDIDIKESNSKKKKKEEKHSFGKYQNVLLTDKEYDKLADDYGIEIRDKAIEFLDMYIPDKCYKSKSHNMAIRRWVIDAVTSRKSNQSVNKAEQQLNQTASLLQDFIRGGDCD